MGFDPISAVASGAGDIAGGLLGYFGQQEATQKNIDMQRDFAQHGIQWKVEDAARAGINPLYALGASTSSPGFTIAPNDHLADMAHNLGQDISRSVGSTMSAEDRAKRDAMDKLNLERVSLQNDLLRHQIAAVRQPENPPLPIDGSVSGVHDVMKSRRSPESVVFGDRNIPLDKRFEAARGTLSDAYHGIHVFEFLKKVLSHMGSN